MTLDILKILTIVFPISLAFSLIVFILALKCSKSLQTLEPKEEYSLDRIDVVILVIILLAFLGMRLPKMFESMEVLEHSYLAEGLAGFNGGISAILNNPDAMRLSHPPAWAFFTFIWLHIVPHTFKVPFFWLRLPSLLCGIAALTLLYAWISSRFGTFGAVMAAFFIAINPLAARFDADLSPYAALTFAFVCSLFFLDRFRFRHRLTDLWAFLGVGIVMSALHYYGGFIFVALWLIALMNILQSGKYLLKPFIVGTTAVFCFMIPHVVHAGFAFYFYHPFKEYLIGYPKHPGLVLVVGKTLSGLIAGDTTRIWPYLYACFGVTGIVLAKNKSETITKGSIASILIGLGIILFEKIRVDSYFGGYYMLMLRHHVFWSPIFAIGAAVFFVKANEWRNTRHVFINLLTVAMLSLLVLPPIIAAVKFVIEPSRPDLNKTKSAIIERLHSQDAILVLPAPYLGASMNLHLVGFSDPMDHLIYKWRDILGNKVYSFIPYFDRDAEKAVANLFFEHLFVVSVKPALFGWQELDKNASNPIIKKIEQERPILMRFSEPGVQVDLFGPYKIRPSIPLTIDLSDSEKSYPYIEPPDATEFVLPNQSKDFLRIALPFPANKKIQIDFEVTNPSSARPPEGHVIKVKCKHLTQRLQWKEGIKSLSGTMILGPYLTDVLIKIDFSGLSFGIANPRDGGRASLFVQKVKVNELSE